uniref:DnaJ homolog subfamily C member 25 n=1 Tax=Gadus morhua TaxID=8049 RepID=A0A8C5B056_GADMO
MADAVHGWVRLWTPSCIILIIATSYIPTADALIEGLYCGTQVCYDVLSVSRDATKPEIARAYRQLARTYHPTGSEPGTPHWPGRRRTALVRPLGDEDSRRDYDYMLDHPEEYYRHYYAYYRTRLAPKVDVRVVILVTSAPYPSSRYLVCCHQLPGHVPKYRIQATEIAKQQGLLNRPKEKGRNRRTKEEVREQEEEVITGHHQKQDRHKRRLPEAQDVGHPTVQAVMLPYVLVISASWYLSWFYREAEHHQMSQSQFDSLEDNLKETFLEKQLWIRENYEVYKQEQEEEMKIKMANDPRMKRYRRWMRNEGPGRLTFADD